MQISNLRPCRKAPPNLHSPRTVLHFDARIADITLRDLSLVVTADGTLLVWSPKADGKPTVHFGKGIRDDIADAAVAEFVAVGGDPALVGRERAA